VHVVVLKFYCSTFHSIVQGADWHYGPKKPGGHSDPQPEDSIKDTALVTAILALIFFVLYLIYQVHMCKELHLSSFQNFCYGFLLCSTKKLT